MGTGWRRFTEGIKQHSPLGSKLTPTSNDRNKLMLEEAGEFKAHIDAFITKLKASETSEEAFLGAVKDALLAPVPRVYQDVAHSEVESPPGSPVGPTGALAKLEGRTRAHPCGERVPLASGLDIDSITAVENSLRTDLQHGVIDPLEAWNEAYHKMREREREVESQRLEVDSRRRTVADLTVKEAKELAAVQRKQDDKHTHRLDEARAVLKHKMEKLDACVARFNEMEGALHADLTALAQDTVHLRIYLANTMKMHGEAFMKLSDRISGELAVVKTELPEPATPLAAGGGATAQEPVVTSAETEERFVPAPGPGTPGEHFPVESAVLRKGPLLWDTAQPVTPTATTEPAVVGRAESPGATSRLAHPEQTPLQPVR